MIKLITLRHYSVIVNNDRMYDYQATFALHAPDYTNIYLQEPIYTLMTTLKPTYTKLH